MKAYPTASLIHHFSHIEDPRINRHKKHRLSDIFFITICATICGADNWVAIETFGKAKREWFTQLLNLENGIPSHDTFGNLFAVIDTQEFSRWVADLTQLTAGQIIAIDGKCLRRSLDRASGKAAIYMVSAWAQQNQLVLGQQKVDDKSNEITAIPKLLTQLNIAGAVITMDAMGCQTKIADQIIQQGELHQDVREFFASTLSPAIGDIRYEGEHGRVETRSIRATAQTQWLQERHPGWRGLNGIVAVTTKRELKDKT